MEEKINKRTQLLLTEKQYKKLQKLSIVKQTSMGHLIREAIDRTYTGKQNKKKIIDDISKLNLPVSDWNTMKNEILKGKLDS